MRTLNLEYLRCKYWSGLICHQDCKDYSTTSAIMIISLCAVYPKTALSRWRYVLEENQSFIPTCFPERDGKPKIMKQTLRSFLLTIITQQVSCFSFVQKKLVLLVKGTLESRLYTGYLIIVYHTIPIANLKSILLCCLIIVQMPNNHVELQIQNISVETEETR